MADQLIVIANKQWPQWLAVIIANLSLFSAGICFTWSSPSLAILQSPTTPFNITNDQASWIASIMPIGSSLGPILGSIVSRSIGPKWTTMLSAIPFIVGFILIAVANNHIYLYISRFISGIAVGVVFTCVPIYIVEVAEDHNRGGLMVVFTMMLSLGSFFMLCLGPYISIPAMAYISLIFPLALLFTMYFLPDSPFFLMRKDKEKEAVKSLKWLRRQYNDSAVMGELDIIKKSVGENFSILKCVKQITVSPNFKAFMIVFSIILTQQFSGILAISFYQEQLYQTITDLPMSPEVGVILSQIIAFISGTGAIFFIDRWGRKPLLTISSIGCALSTSMIGFFYQYSYVLETHPQFYWLPFIGFNLFMVAFSVGLGPTPYTILGEMFGSDFKEVAICAISIIGAIGGSAVAKLFQIINDALGSPVVFFLLSGITVVFTILNWIIVPETMNKNILHIQAILRGEPEPRLPERSSTGYDNPAATC